MDNQIYKCCRNKPCYLIRYKIGTVYQVCEACFTKESWSRGIIEKIPIAEFDGQRKPHSNSATDVITNE